MKNKIIFLAQTSGHHLEYFHHLYEQAGRNERENYIFVVPTIFKGLSSKFIWHNYDNISFYYINDHLIDSLSKNLILRGYQLSKLLKKTVKLFDCRDIFLIDLMTFMPFLPLFFSNNYNISGIIYQIYLYKWRVNQPLKRFQDIIKYLAFANFSCFDKIFILNDNAAYRYLNKLYNTHKFKYLCDPIVPLDTLNITDIRGSLNITDSKKVILHFGALTETKGTMDVFDFIEKTSSHELTKFVFIFAGVIKADIRESFYMKQSQLKNKARIIVFDKFLDFDFIGSLFYSSDVIFCPYKRVFQSSGVIGYAAQFNKPVLVPDKGFLGKLVRNNKLGCTFSSLDNKEILNALNKADNLILEKTYLKTHLVEDFAKTILNRC